MIGKRTNLEQLLVAEVITRIQFKYQHVVDSVLPPPVRVDSQQKSAEKQQEESSVQTQHDGPLAFVFCVKPFDVNEMICYCMRTSFVVVIVVTIAFFSTIRIQTC